MYFNINRVYSNKSILDSFDDINQNANSRINNLSRSDKRQFADFLYEEIEILKLEMDALKEENERIRLMPIDKQKENGYAIGPVYIGCNDIYDYGSFFYRFEKSDNVYNQIYNLRVGEHVELINHNLNVLLNRSEEEM